MLRDWAGVLYACASRTVNWHCGDGSLFGSVSFAARPVEEAVIICEALDGRQTEDMTGLARGVGRVVEHQVCAASVDDSPSVSLSSMGTSVLSKKGAFGL